MADIKLGLFGFQARAPKGLEQGGPPGTEGFVGYGLNPAIDYLFLRACAGRGGGKTMAGALRLLCYIIAFPNSVGMVTAPIYDTIRRVNLPAIYKAFSLVGWQRGIDYEYAEQKKVMEVKATGSIIYFGSTELPQNLRGPDIHFLWMDEPRDSPEIAFLIVQPTLRAGGGYPHQAWFTSTPAGKRWWLRKVFMPDEYEAEFGDNEDVDEGAIRPFQGQYRTYNAHTWDNPYPLPAPLTDTQRASMTEEELKFHELGGGMKLYLTSVRNYGGEKSLMTRQELFGEELMMEGLVYPDWNPEYHVKPVDQWPVKKPKRILAGVDFGFENPFGILVMGIDGEGREYILDEYAKSHLSEEAMIKAATRVHKKWDIQHFFCDTEDPGKIRAMRWAGLPARKANKKRELGIDKCSTALNARMPDGSQAFFVNPKCVHFRREIESWVKDDIRLNKDPSEMPRSGGHDLMDCFRYGQNGIERLWGDRGAANRPRSLKTTYA